MTGYHPPELPPQQPDEPDNTQAMEQAPPDSEAREGAKARLAAWQLEQAMARAALDMTIGEQLGMELSEYEDAARMSLEDLAARLGLPMPELPDRPTRPRLFVPSAIYGYPGEAEDGAGEYTGRITQFKEDDMTPYHQSSLYVPEAIYGQPGDVQRDADGYYPDSYRLEPPREQE